MTEPRTEARINLGAIRSNVAHLAQLAGSAQVMAIVKADAYGHGLLPAARAALDGGASWLGTAAIEECLALRAAGITAPLFCWLTTPNDDLDAPIAAGIDLSVDSVDEARAMAAAAARVGEQARVHLKIDTGMSRGGATLDDWPELLAAVLAEPGLHPIGIWSHLAASDDPDPAITNAQLGVFHAALDIAKAVGFEPQVRHIANTAATLTRPDTHFDMVRPGLGCWGLSPLPDGDPEAVGLSPAMTFRTTVLLSKRVAAGVGVSYGHTYHTSKETTLAALPVGYADGIPRAVSNKAPVWVRGKVYRIAGRVCMNHIVLDCGDDEIRAGDDAILFGPGTRGEPTAQDWAEAADTINYEIVTRIAAGVVRSYDE